MTRGRARARRRPLDQGMTLAELIVSMGLMGLLGSLILAVSIVAIRTTDQLQVRVENQAQGEVGMSAVSRLLRGAILPEQIEDRTCTDCEKSAVTVASGIEVRFYADVPPPSGLPKVCGTTPSLVTATALEDPNRAGTGILRVRVQPHVIDGDRFSFPTTTTCTPSNRVVARGLVWPIKDPVFAYFKYNGDSIGAGGAALSATDRPAVASVDVNLVVRTEKRFRSLTTVSRVRLPNVDINVVEEK